MESTLVAIGVLVLLGAGAALVVLVRRGTGGAAPSAWPVYAKRLLNEREQVLYHRLVQAYPGERVLVQVAFSQLVGLKKTAERTALFNRYGRLVADFVLCGPDFTPRAVFELDGASHDRPARARADATKADVLAAAGIELVRLNSKSANDVGELHAQLAPRAPAARPRAVS
jgi:very-short-patch-repair endonuclease